MDARWLLLMLVALLAGAQSDGVQGEGACPAPAPPPVSTIASLARKTLEEVMEEVPGAQCRRQMALVMEGIHNLTDWALSMADATAKLQAGLLSGHIRALGDMDECVAVEEATGAPVRGKYCLASGHAYSDNERLDQLLDVATAGRRTLEPPHRQLTLRGGEIVTLPGFVPELSRFEWGVCVPAVCSGADVEAALKELARRLLAATDLRFDVRVPEEACQTSDGPAARPLGAGHYGFATLCGVLVLLVIVGTTWDSCRMDATTDGTSSCKAVLRAFSLRTSWRRLTHDRQEEIGCISGLRALNCMYLVFAHEMLNVQRVPIMNATHLLTLTTSFIYMPLMTAPIATDTFFTISGALYSYAAGDMIIEGRFNYMAALLYRFIRLSPIYYLVLWFYATFFEFLGEGPNWNSIINFNVQMCKDNWIFNALYINNYIDSACQCMTQSWFLAADMQLFVLAPLVLVPLYRWRRGRMLLLVLIALAVVVGFATVIIMRVPGIYRVFDTDLDLLYFFSKNHLRTHVHISSYLAGVFLGYILHRFKNKNVSLSKMNVAIGWLASQLMFLAVWYGPYHMLQKSYEFNAFYNAAYPSLSRLFWGIAISWVIFACHTGYGGLVNRFLSCYALRVISRLTYASNMSHFILALHNFGRRRVPYWIDELTLIHNFIGDYGIAMIMAFVLYVTVESPIDLVTRTFLFKGFSKTKPSSPVSSKDKNK